MSLLILWVPPRQMVVEVGLLFELAAAGRKGAVLGQLGHVVHERVEEVSQLRDLHEFLLRRDLLLKYDYSLTIIPSRSSPRLLVSSSSLSTRLSFQYLCASGIFCKLCRAFAATLARSMSSRLESFKTSTNFSSTFESWMPSS